MRGRLVGAVIIIWHFTGLVCNSYVFFYTDYSCSLIEAGHKHTFLVLDLYNLKHNGEKTYCNLPFKHSETQVVESIKICCSVWQVGSYVTDSSIMVGTTEMFLSKFESTVSRLG